MNTPLRLFSKFVCFATFILVFAGSLVTSTGSGLSVPDWPLSYGTLFPPMVGGVRFEHSHRLIAGFVASMTVILAIWLWRAEKRSWVKKLGFAAVGAVFLQALLGGLTVLFFLPTPISVSHAMLGQTFFLITIWIAYSQSTEFLEKPRCGVSSINSQSIANLQSNTHTLSPCASTYKFALLLIAVLYIQLLLGALMRHTGSGLAIPDFPKMGGEWWPSLSDNLLAKINVMRFEMLLDPVSKGQVLIHLLHRFWAIVVTLCVITTGFLTMTRPTLPVRIRLNGFAITVLVFIQVLLGIATVLSGKSPLITSLHVATGALLLGLSALLALRLHPPRDTLKDRQRVPGATPI